MAKCPEEIQSIYNEIMHEFCETHEIQSKNSGTWITNKRTNYLYRLNKYVILWYDPNTWGPSIWIGQIKVITLDTKFNEAYDRNHIPYIHISNPNFDIVSEIKQYLGGSEIIYDKNNRSK